MARQTRLVWGVGCVKSARAQSTQHEAAMLLSHALTGVTAVVGDGEVDLAGAPLLVVCTK